MSLILSLLLSFFTIQASAQVYCGEVLQIDGFTEWRNKSNELMRAAIVGDVSKGDKELFVNWHTGNPYRLIKDEDGTYHPILSGKRMRNYRNNRDENSANPLEYVNTLFARQDTSNEKMLGETLANYDQRMPEEEIEAIKKTEAAFSEVADIRQSYGFVAEGRLEDGHHAIGTMRVVNGSAVHSQTPALLALEHYFLSDKFITRIAERLLKLRLENPKQLIFEIGKFSLEGPARLRDRARAFLELFLLRYFIDALPEDALYFVHVGSESRIKLYQRRYGFEVIEEVLMPNGTKEYILEATGGKLREKFGKLYPIPKPSVQILP